MLILATTDAVITVISQNGSLDLRRYNFRLLFSRREDDRVVARLVAQLNGVIRAKIEPEEDGKDQTEAFLALRKDVEMKLERILQAVPSGGEDVDAVAGPSSPSAMRPGPGPGPGGRSLIPSDAPPAYEGDMKRKSAKR
jgi:hypothetical protein